MTVVGYPYNLIRGLSDFWQRFFVEADQLESLYEGTAIQIGQAYLDYMSTVLGVSLKDAVALDLEYFRLLPIREDDIRYVEGATPTEDRWALTLPEGVVSFTSLDNKVYEPTASLEPGLDYTLDGSVVLFIYDPTDPAGDGVPLPGYARRGLDVSIGGKFTATAVSSWPAEGVRKGDTLRILDVGPDGTQRLRSDHPIVLVRADAFYVSSDTPFAGAATGVSYVVLRTSADAVIVSESATIVVDTITLAHTRIDQGSLRVFAKNPSGADVVEGVDYVVNYEHGEIHIKTAWAGSPGPYGVDYTWKKEVSPLSGASPRVDTTGVTAVVPSTVRLVQMAAWALDVRVDRGTLAKNFGALIGREGASSEAYRAFLSGIFQLYVLGPVLQRIESALNVVLGLPVVREDGEVYQTTDTTDPVYDRILTTSPITGKTNAYEYAKGTPLRTDLVVGQSLLSFEPLTTAVAVTDYVQTPDWWHNEMIPPALFSAGYVPSAARRFARAEYVNNVVNAPDSPEVGDPGLIVGADENGFIPPPGQPIFRHRLAFVLMDRYFRYHTFSVKFDILALSAVTGTAFQQGVADLNDLVLTAKPSHTYAFTTPATSFEDDVDVEDSIIFVYQAGSGVYGPDKVIITDDAPVIGAGIWNVGDYFKYELWTASTAFGAVGVPVVLANAPVAPRGRRLVNVYIDGDVGGLRLVENVDYSVDYVNCTITRLTAWTSTTVDVTYRQLNTGNLVDAPLNADDMPLYTDSVDAALITAAYDPTAAGWDGVTTPPTAPRDLGLVERALIVHAHP